MSMVIVPNFLSEAIYRVIDSALEKCPEAKPDREVFYHQLLRHYDETGVVPSEITLVKNQVHHALFESPKINC